MPEDPKPSDSAFDEYKKAVGAKTPDGKYDPSQVQAGAGGLKPKATGRGMRPGETVPAWKARLAAEDTAADSPQKKAIKGMIDTKSEEAPK